MDVVVPRRSRRTHSEAFKRSVVGVALVNGLNVNQVHRWMRERGIAPPSRRQPVGAALTTLSEAGFLPVQVARDAAWYAKGSCLLSRALTIDRGPALTAAQDSDAGATDVRKP